MAEIHEGINGQHMGAKALARKALRAGYYWPTMVRDATEHVRRCDQCQRNGLNLLAPPAELAVITAPWPFFKWGMDLLGPFPAAEGQLRWLIVAVDYFTKWIEAEPIATITTARVKKFFERNIMCRFGIPAEIITDNGTQFASKHFQELMTELKIKHHFASVEHPQSNGLAEAANKIITEGLRKRLGEAPKGKWVEELYHVLWAYRTTTQSSTGETPFRLAYGTEAMIPVELGEPSWRRVARLNSEEKKNSESLAAELDLIDEVRVEAHCRDMNAKQLVAKRYNQKVRPRTFEVGDLVLRRADIGGKNAGDGKLAAKWEGPYRIGEELKKGAYTLMNLEGKIIKRTWNADKLKKYYS